MVWDKGLCLCLFANLNKSIQKYFSSVLEKAEFSLALSICLKLREYTPSKLKLERLSFEKLVDFEITLMQL